MSDLIDRTEAISRAVELRMYGKPVKMVAVSELERLPSVRAELGENSPSEQPQMNELGVKTGETCADTISRQAAIEKFEPWLKVDGYSEGELNMLRAVLYELRFLPSAQPEKRTEEHTETHACDCISRQAAIELIERMKPYHQDADDIAEMIDNMPSAQPERKTGRWIEENPQNSPDCRLIKCSECGDTYIVNMSIDYADWIEGRNFCRRCGADLRGGNNGKST